jgi:hypothetical protein
MRKTENKQNLIKWIIISFFIFWAINAIVVFSSSLIYLSSPLWSRAMIFAIISVLLFVIEAKQHKTQKYYKPTPINIICTLIILIISCLVGFQRTHLSNLSFETTDPAVHFSYAQRFSESDKLLEFSGENKYFDQKRTDKIMFFSYTYLGSLFQFIQPIANQFWIKVIIFNVTEMIVLACSGILLYFIVEEQLKKGVIKRLFLLILSLLFLLGYPLNNLLFGFHYLGYFIISALLIIDLMFEFRKKYHERVFIVLLALEGFLVFMTYYMFVPVIFASTGLYLLYVTFIKKDYAFKVIIKTIIFSLIIPFVIGCFYYFIYNKIFLPGESYYNTANAFELEGYIYRNLIGNFVLLLPAFIYSIFISIKKKELQLITLMIIIELLFMLVIYIPFYKGDFASYYFYKNYYLLWPLMFINLGGLLSLSDNQSYDFVKTNLIMMLLVFGLYKSGIENRLTDKNILLNPTSFSTSINDIYFFNDFIMNNREDILSRDEIIDLSEVKTKIPLEHTLYYEKDILRRLWYYNIMQNPHDPAKNYIASIYDEPEDLQTVLQRNSIEYVIIPKNNNQPTLDQPVEFENNSFAVYKINH